MSNFPNELANLASRIEDAENRAERLRGQIAGWAREGEDTIRARQLLHTIEDELRQFYLRQANLRRDRWVRNGTGDRRNRGSTTFMVVATCPTTRREISTGIIMDFVSFNRLAARHPPFRCSVCGQLHRWSIDAARLVGPEEPAAWIGSTPEFNCTN